MIEIKLITMYVEWLTNPDFLPTFENDLRVLSMSILFLGLQTLKNHPSFIDSYLELRFKEFWIIAKNNSVDVREIFLSNVVVIDG